MAANLHGAPNRVRATQFSPNQRWRGGALHAAFASLGCNAYIASVATSGRPMPAIIRTMQPTLTTAIPRGAGWVQE
jgi:hypothetical protein